MTSECHKNLVALALLFCSDEALSAILDPDAFDSLMDAGDQYPGYEAMIADAWGLS